MEESNQSPAAHRLTKTCDQNCSKAQKQKIPLRLHQHNMMKLQAALRVRESTRMTAKLQQTRIQHNNNLSHWDRNQTWDVPEPEEQTHEWLTVNNTTTTHPAGWTVMTAAWTPERSTSRFCLLTLAVLWTLPPSQPPAAAVSCLQPPPFAAAPSAAAPPSSSLAPQRSAPVVAAHGAPCPAAAGAALQAQSISRGFRLLSPKRQS